jgi:uncharacterized protein (DUF1810 family)
MTHSITRTQARPVSRFIDAQRAKYPQILREIQQGRKRTHWMWYVFPQLSALAKSETARYYGLADRAEALAYLDNPVLRVRLGECSTWVLNHRRLMFNHPDDKKLHASMTLFSQVVVDPTLPNAILAKFFGGRPHQLTLDVLAGKSIPVQQTAMGRVEWQPDLFSRTSRSVPVSRPARVDTMGRTEVVAFVRGLGVSPGQARIIADEWLDDRDRAYEKGLSEGRDEGWEDAQQSYMG